jgi:hypothetical protein
MAEPGAHLEPFTARSVGGAPGPARRERDRADLGYVWIAGRTDWLDSSERRP